MKHVGTIRIETERLILRKFKLSDAKNMFKNYTSHDVVTEYLTWKPHKSIEDTKAYLKNIVLPDYDQIDTYRWAIELKETNEVVGCIDVVSKNDSKFRAELGWVLSDFYWGRGLMPEAAREVLKVLFDVGYIRVQALHDVNNPKSGRVMAKIGMTHEGVLKKFNFNKDGNLVDCDIWAIIKDE